MLLVVSIYFVLFFEGEGEVEGKRVMMIDDLNKLFVFEGTFGWFGW